MLKEMLRSKSPYNGEALLLQGPSGEYRSLPCSHPATQPCSTPQPRSHTVRWLMLLLQDNPSRLLVHTDAIP
jgi:hypothetical protein